MLSSPQDEPPPTSRSVQDGPPPTCASGQELKPPQPKRHRARYAPQGWLSPPCSCRGEGRSRICHPYHRVAQYLRQPFPLAPARSLFATACLCGRHPSTRTYTGGWVTNMLPASETAPIYFPRKGGGEGGRSRSRQAQQDRKTAAQPHLPLALPLQMLDSFKKSASLPTVLRQLPGWILSSW